MQAESLSGLIEQLGVAGALVGVLVWLLRQANEERREASVRFLAALETTIRAQADDRRDHAAALAQHAAALAELTGAVRDLAEQQRHEHSQHLEALRWLNGRQKP